MNTQKLHYKFYLLFIFSFILTGNSFNLLARGQVIPNIDGDGDADNPYLIDSAHSTTPLEKLNKIANWVNKTDDWDSTWTSNGMHFKLEANISGFTNTIGTRQFPFEGIFDGNNHMVTVNIYKPTIDRVGLFGQANNATITQLTVAGSVRGAHTVGGLLGFGSNVTVSFCTNVANVVAKNIGNGLWQGWVAGIVGGTNYGGLTILNCVNTGTIYGNWNVGGIVGDGFDRTTIISCINIGTIKGHWRWVGGIAGRDPYEIENCMNAGFVVAYGHVGGIVGTCDRNGAVAIKNCLNTGVIHGNQPAGAIVGHMKDSSLLQNNYYDKQMCTKGGVAGSTTNSTIAEGLNTEDLTGFNPFGTQWKIIGSNFYPVPTGGNAGVGNIGYNSGQYDNQCIENVAAAAIILQSLPIPPFPETTDNVLARFFLSYHPDNIGDNTWTAKNNTIELYSVSGEESIWKASGPARTDTMVAKCEGFSKQVPLNIPRLIQKSASFAEISNNFSFVISEVTPSIVTDNATIDIQTATEGNLNVSIYDLAGTKVANITDRYVNANSELQINLNNLAGLSTGSYMAVVSAGNEVVMRKFVKE